ncbi:MAG: ATP-binding protein, partial [Clostridium sp.]
ANKLIRSVSGDGNKMQRVFQNIISNILKYSKDNSKVYIQLEQGESITLEKGYYTRITFKNTSANVINIKEEELIERFRRGDCSRNTEGSGLGLNIAKSLVEVQGGEFKINIENNIFTVSIVL